MRKGVFLFIALMNLLWDMKYKREVTCDQFGTFNVNYLDFFHNLLLNIDTKLSFNSLYNVKFFLVHGILYGWCSLIGYKYYSCKTC